MLSVGRFDELSTAMCVCVMALFLIVAFFLTCGREINAAIRVTIRRATPQTADHVFEGVLREKIENRQAEGRRTRFVNGAHASSRWAWRRDPCGLSIVPREASQSCALRPMCRDRARPAPWLSAQRQARKQTLQCTRSPHPASSDCFPNHDTGRPIQNVPFMLTPAGRNAQIPDIRRKRGEQGKSTRAASAIGKAGFLRPDRIQL